MELTERKKAVLSAIIKSYIDTGEPVGSKILTELIANAPSSATLRNEMSELCALGFLEQPHTSAGRVPTNTGLRLYLNSLMPRANLSESAKRFIDERISDINCDIEHIPSCVGKIISDLTGLPAITCFVAQREITVKKIELLPIGKNTKMLIVITSDGRARNRIIRVDYLESTGILEKFTEICSSRIKNKEIGQLNKPYMQSIIATAGIDLLSLLPLFTVLFELIEDIDNSSVDISGEPQLYNICADETAARRIISLIKRRDPIISLMNEIKEGVGVIFGSDTEFGEFFSDTIVAAHFGSKVYKGTLAVIGPKRISYEQVIPSIEYATQRLDELMCDALKDMED